MNLPHPTSVAVIGAGLAGSLCARLLADQGVSVTLFDKARHVGGRTSSRQSRRDAHWVMDHGLPAFHTTSTRTQQWLNTWVQQGLLEQWTPRQSDPTPRTDYYVGIPFNHSVAESLSGGITQQVQTRIHTANREQDQWFLADDTASFGPFDTLVCTAPPAQARTLLPFAALDTLLDMPFEPCHALMMGFSEPLCVTWDAARPTHPVLAWVSRESSKPGRPEGERWLVQTTADWSEAHLEDVPDTLVPFLLKTFQDYTGVDIAPQTIQIHRWRYARPADPLHIGSWWDDRLRLGLCGDWLNGGQVDGAIHSAHHLADRVLRKVPHHA